MNHIDERKYRHEKIIETANRQLDIIIPVLMEKYDIELRKPHITTSTNDYMNYKDPFDATMDKISYIGDNGGIKLLQESCINERICGRVASHCMGHIAFYQGSNEFKEFHKNYYKLAEKDDSIMKKLDILLLMDEGVAQIFQRDGVKALAQEKKSIYLEIPKIWIDENIIYRGYYGKGRKIISKMLKIGFKIKDILKSPIEYEGYVEKKFFPNS